MPGQCGLEKTARVRRRMKEREAVALTDDGQAAPLYPKGLSFGGSVLHGTDALDPSPLRRWKAAAVISMLDKKCGEDTFKKLLERLVMNAINSESRGAGFDSLQPSRYHDVIFLIEACSTRSAERTPARSCWSAWS